MFAQVARVPLGRRRVGRAVGAGERVQVATGRPGRRAPSSPARSRPSGGRGGRAAPAAQPGQVVPDLDGVAQAGELHAAGHARAVHLGDVGHGPLGARRGQDARRRRWGRRLVGRVGAGGEGRATRRGETEGAWTGSRGDERSEDPQRRRAPDCSSPSAADLGPDPGWQAGYDEGVGVLHQLADRVVGHVALEPDRVGCAVATRSSVSCSCASPAPRPCTARRSSTAALGGRT